MPRHRKDILGHKFAHWTVLNRAEGTTNSWICKCDCGTVRAHNTNDLISKHTKSCGCQKANFNRSNRPVSQNPKDGGWAYAVTVVKASIKVSKRDLQLSYEDIKSLISSDCVYCGEKPSIKIRNCHVLRNGIDRVDSSIDYVLGNCVSCCSQCNYAKNDYTYQEFISHAERVVTFSKGRKHG